MTGHRYYHPETGRWISRDPIEERGGFHLYMFAQNNSIQQYDLLGAFVPPSSFDKGIAKIVDVLFDLLKPYLSLLGNMSVKPTFHWFGPSECPPGQTLWLDRSAHIWTYYESESSRWKPDPFLMGDGSPEVDADIILQRFDILMLRTCIKCCPRFEIENIDIQRNTTEWEWIVGGEKDWKSILIGYRYRRRYHIINVNTIYKKCG